MKLRNYLMKLMLVASLVLIFLGNCSTKERRMADEIADLGLNTLETPESNVVSKNPFLRFNWLNHAKERDSQWEIGPLAPLHRIRPVSVRASVSANEGLPNSLHGSGIDVISKKYTSVRRPTMAKMMEGRVHKMQRHPSNNFNVNHTIPRIEFITHASIAGGSRRRVPRDTPFVEQEFPTLDTQHKRVKKDSVTYPGPIYLTPQQQPFRLKTYDMPPLQQPQRSQNPDFMQQPRAFQPNMQFGGPGANINSMPMPPPPGPRSPPGIPQLAPQPQPPFGPAVFANYYQNPDDIIKTDSGPFHFHIPIVSDVPQPFPDMTEMMKIAQQYKNPLDEEALLPEEKRRPIVPLFLQPYVLPNRRFSRNLEKMHTDSEPKLSTRDQIQQAPSNAVYNNQLNDDEFDEALQEQERLLLMSKLEDQLSMMQKNNNIPVQKIEEHQTADPEPDSSDTTTTAMPVKTDTILVRKKRGFFKWIKGLFHKKEPEPEPELTHEHDRPVPSYQKPPKIRTTTTTQRSRPPPDESAEAILRKHAKPTFRREPPVHITAPTKTSKISQNKHDAPPTPTESGYEVPSKPKLPANPESLSKSEKLVKKETGVDTKVDELLPEYMRTSAYLERTTGERKTSKNYEAPSGHSDYADAEDAETEPKTRTKRSTNVGGDFSFLSGTNDLVMSKQEMRLLHELFLNVVSRKCLVNRDQLIYVGMSIQNIIQMSNMPEFPFSASNDPLAARLAQQLVTCRSLNNRSPLDPFRFYNFRLPLVNPNQFQTGPVSNQILGEVDEGDPVLRTKRGKRSIPHLGSYIQIRPPMQLAYLLHVEFLITQIVKEHCGPGLDQSSLKAVGDMLLRTIEKVCRERQCFSAQLEPAVNLDNDLYFCSRRSFQQNSY